MRQAARDSEGALDDFARAIALLEAADRAAPGARGAARVRGGGGGGDARPPGDPSEDEVTADVYHQRGTVLHQLKRFGEARDDFARALARAPRNAVVWNLRGLCDAQLGDVAAARDAYARATRLDARFKEAWANLAQLERDAGRGEAALDGFDAALALDAGYAHARMLKAACLYALGDVRAARAEAARAPANHLECAQQVSPRSPRAAPRARSRRGGDDAEDPPLSRAGRALPPRARRARRRRRRVRARARRGRRRRARRGRRRGRRRRRRHRRRARGAGRGRARQRVQRHRRGAGAAPPRLPPRARAVNARLHRASRETRPPRSHALAPIRRF